MEGWSYTGMVDTKFGEKPAYTWEGDDFIDVGYNGGKPPQKPKFPIHIKYFNRNPDTGLYILRISE